MAVAEETGSKNSVAASADAKTSAYVGFLEASGRNVRCYASVAEAAVAV